MKNPAYYRGSRKKKRYFEGWYFKCISADRRHALAIIPGMSADRAGQRHAFIQVINAASGKTYYFHFPFEEFYAARDQLEIRIAGNTFGSRGLQLDIASEEGKIKGTLHFSEIQPYPVTRWHPSIMGPYAFLPLMECYHAIIHLQHRLQGSLELDGEIFDFTDGGGYIEKDYGRSFPERYLWLQAGHFPDSKASFVFSKASIPFLGGQFEGFFAYLSDFGSISARFATYNGSSLKDWHVDLAQRTCRGELHGPGGRLVFSAQMAGGGRLRAPVDGLMNREIIESITARVTVSLYDRQGHLVFNATSQEAGMEICLD